MKKKLSLILISLSLLINLSIVNVSAKNSKEKKDNPHISQLEKHIKKGKGTQEDPYIIDDDCPYKEILDQQIAAMFETVVDSSNGSMSVKEIPVLGFNFRNLRTSRLLAYDFNGALSNYYDIRQLGGKWSSQSNIPNVNSDGNCWIRNIAYFPHTNEGFKELYKLRVNSSYTQVITNYAFSWGGVALEKKLVDIGIIAIDAHLMALTIPVAIVSSYGTLYTSNKIKTADNNNWGLLTINYATSYHGSWYATSTLCYWTTYPKVYIPAKCYSLGTYTSYTKSDWRGWDVYVGIDK